MGTKKPVFSLRVGDVFLGRDGRRWEVSAVTEPDNWRTNNQIGEAVRPFRIEATTTGIKQTHMMQGFDLVECR